MTLTRRGFLDAAFGVSAIVSAPALSERASGKAHVWRQGDPFSLGVAAGSPRPNGFVIWTRLAPDPLCEDPNRPGGMVGDDVYLSFEIATDAEMKNIIRRGDATAEQDFGHSVHADIAGLEPAKSYWYRFLCGEASSRIGRAMTLARAGTEIERLRFGFVSCSNYEHGFFSAYRHLADENPDFILFLGDYIYEYADKLRPIVRTHSDGITANTLPEYRRRYAQYKLDPDLQRLHAEVPALITWDDHEVSNDYANRWSQNFDDPSRFLLRRAAAYQAFYEHMPLRPTSTRPIGPALRIYDRFTFGNLLEISMLDGRQYRSREACYGPPAKGGGHIETTQTCPERGDPTRSMLGFAQENWLYDGLSRSGARWNIIGQGQLMANFRFEHGGQSGYWTDGWDGYPAARRRFLSHIHELGISNVVVLGGDLHSFWANELKLNFLEPASSVVATEFVGTSISAPLQGHYAPFVSDNPHVRFFNGRTHGYVSIDLEAHRMTTRLRSISDAKDPDATVETLKTFTVEAGRPGLVPG